jgi:1-deoxy-D-xylulose-5-phosphate reductoisomerase
VSSTIRNVVLLGATGSIGESTCTVLRQYPDHLRLVGIGCYRNWQKAAAIAREFRVSHIAILDEGAAQLARESGEFAPGTQIMSGMEGLRNLAVLPAADILVSALVGTAGLLPTLDAIHADKQIALANKEILVMAGDHVMQAVRSKRRPLLPVDSEHNALMQCLRGNDPASVKQLWLTASGGAFLQYSPQQLANVTPQDALRHPNWNMGSKVTIDSATLANKGLEMIEARWLFDMQPQQIQVVVHPQSIVHSMVEYRDGSFIAQLCPPSMVFPIQNALLYPERLSTPLPTLDFQKRLTLDFLPPDEQRFPCLALARRAMEQGGWFPAVFNAANEVAVDAFLHRNLPFLEIPQIIDYTLQQCPAQEYPTLDAILSMDQQARLIAADRVLACISSLLS